MSRHDLKPRADRPNVVRATVGWDRPLQTFFAQVFVRTEDQPEDGEAVIWVGTDLGEILSAEAAIAVVAPFVEIPHGLAARLATDMTASVGEKDGHHQIAVKRALYGSSH